ncbi:(d)CMP kinase [Paenibacillus koleovorans]|uniref:(d)CMP kinase n=1 Tax=Paenibacillus koleovorans TaxID=121608 RepID=UPI0013E3A244|nr:(d)CMP kinase [Paenibacillus koleovorans]
MNKMNIAIDGPAGAGKSTVARIVATKLGYVYVDTGAMYRAVTWKALSSGLTPDQSEPIAAMAQSMRLVLQPGHNGQVVLADGQDVTEMIRSPQVTANVSQVSQIPAVRERLVKMQKELAQAKGVVMDGRDIGTQVLPDAEVKVYLTASLRERAMRRFDEMKTKHPDLTIEQAEQDLAERDRKDQEREVSPLRQANDAILLDTTGMGIEQVAERILEISQASAGKGA